MTLSSYIELFIFKGHSKQELIKFHCSAVKKCKQYHLHFMAGRASEAKTPTHGGQQGDLEDGLHGRCWVWLVWPHLQLFPWSPGHYCSLNILRNAQFNSTGRLCSLCSPYSRGWTLLHVKGQTWEWDRAWVRISALPSALGPQLRWFPHQLPSEPSQLPFPPGH